MATSQLALYNGALRRLGERKLASLTENREPRRLLDDAWDDAARLYCLQQGLWKFAKRTVKLDYDPDQTPTFGHRYAFGIPSDFVRTIALCSDEYFTCPLLDYAEEQQFWFASIQTLYISYVSSDPDYGLDLSKWPPTFTQWVEAYLARQVGPKITSAVNRMDALDKEARHLLTDARSKDAMEDPTSFAPMGSWARARRGRSGGWNDRGNRGSLIG